MNSAKNVAQWMFQSVQSDGYLFQDSAVYEINSQFGDQFTYTNPNGNLAIGKDVLKEFKKISDGKVVWQRGDKSWRTVFEDETYESRQVD